MEKRSRDILAVIAQDKKHLAGGKAQAFLADSEEACQSMAEEIAQALHGEIISLSNGVFLILDI
ncbi:hypothetical protein EV586_101715 [Tumebacillus sp. BK434]|uniref:capping complex subunit for YIEGIA n=1 Tax=Tumebacillus sp. BK434 TaxID=2512169 RepID=UPI00104FAAB9|nr:hypothetical protein [Tumebacillus sp. BK434]TCP59496.1 hypothetical protein EV586_101715 [Tumebacillus sp. BK434]